MFPRFPRTARLAILAVVAAVRLAAWEETAESHLGRAYDALKLERYEEAAGEFRAALRLDPKLAMRARFPLAVSLFQMKDSQAARREFEIVRRESGDHPNIRYYLGRLDLLDQHFADAVRNLTEAMRGPPFPDTAYHLGFACLKLGDLAGAEKWLKTAAEANPLDSAVPYQLALVYRREGNEEAAKKEFARSAEIRQRDTEHSQLKLECVQKLNRGPRDEALAVCSRLYDPSDVVKLTELGTIYGQHGELEAALGPLRRAAELAPQSPQTQYNLAFTYYELNRFEEARIPIARAVERWPDIFQLSALYGGVLLKLGRQREALPVLRRAHQLNPADARTAELLYRAALSLGQTALANRDYAEALARLEEAAQLRPEDPEPRQAIAQAKAAGGAK